MKRTILYNTSTKRWEVFTVHRTRMPWERIGVRIRLMLRNFIDFYRLTLLPPYETGLQFNAKTLTMRNSKTERRTRRRERRAERFAKIADALNSMIQMQKHLK